MAFIAVLLATFAVLFHQVSLNLRCDKDPNIFFRVNAVDLWLLRLSDPLFWGLSFVGAFLLAILVGEIGVVGLVLGILLAAVSVWDVIELRKL